MHEKIQNNNNKKITKKKVPLSLLLLWTGSISAETFLEQLEEYSVKAKETASACVLGFENV